MAQRRDWKDTKASFEAKIKELEDELAHGQIMRVQQADVIIELEKWLKALAQNMVEIANYLAAKV